MILVRGKAPKPEPEPHDDAPLSAHLSVGLTRADKAAVRAAAARDDVSMSEWGRRAVSVALLADCQRFNRQ